MVRLKEDWKQRISRMERQEQKSNSEDEIESLSEDN